MPDYKKKDIKRVNPKKPRVKNEKKSKKPAEEFDGVDSIKMTAHRPTETRKSAKKPSVAKPTAKKPVRRGRTAQETPEQYSNLRVVEGNKKRRARQRYISVFIGFFLVLTVIAFSIFTPTGIPETVTNIFSAFGGGPGFPVRPDGDKVISLQTSGTNMFVLSDTNLTAYNEGGRNFFGVQHGFNNPVLDVSEARSLVYNRGGNSVIISNNKQTLFKKEMQFPIISADIGRDGTCVFATKATGYAGQVEVYDKNFQSKFKWLSAEELISDVAVSKDGNRIAVATFSVKQGRFDSKIYCFRYNSKNPVFTTELSDMAVLSLTDVSTDVFAACTDSAVNFIHWDDGSNQKASSSENKLVFFKKADSGESVAVSQSVSSSKTYQVKVYSAKGKEKSSFEYKGSMNDIAIKDDFIYILDNGNILYLSKKGQTVATVKTQYMTTYVAAISNSKVAGANDSTLSLYSK